MTVDAVATALRDLPGALVVCDARGRIVAANPAVHELLGHPAGTLVGTALEALVPDDLRDLHRRHRERFARRTGARAHRGARLLSARRADGTTVAVDIAIANVQTDDGTLSVALLRDLTDPEAAARQVGRLAELYAFLAQALSLVPRAETADDLWAAVCDVAVDRRLATLAYVAEVAGDHLVVEAVSGPLAAAVGTLEVDVADDHPVATATTLGTAVVVPDLGLEPAFAVAPGAADRAGSLCAVPVHRDEQVVAVLTLVSPLVSGFTDATVTVLEWLAAELGAHLDRQGRRGTSEREVEDRLAAAAEQHRHEIATAVAVAVAEALAAERAAVRARSIEEATSWGRYVEEAVAEARAAERAAADDELRAAQAAIEHGTAALTALQQRLATERLERDAAVASAVTAARADAAAAAEARLRDVAAAHDEALAEAVTTTRAEERTAAGVRARYAEDAHQRALAKAVEAARAEERAAADERLAAELEARRAAEEELAADPGRAARVEAHAAHQDVAVQLALLALATGDPVDVADAVVGAAGRTLGVDSTVLVEATAGNPHEVRAAWFGSQPTTGPYQPSRHADLHEALLAHGSPLVVQDLAADPRFARLVAPGDSGAGVAVLVGGEPGFHGSLSVVSMTPRRFDPDEVALLERLAEIIAASFERARDHAPPGAEVPRPSPEPSPAADLGGTVTDSLTGLPNRALLRDRIEQLLARTGVDDPTVGVLVAQVDRIPQLVEGYGSDVVDGLLVSMAGRLRASMDATTVVARTGPHALAVLHATDGDVEAFADLADRSRLALDAPHTVGDVPVSATVSIGVSVRPAHDASADQLLTEAESAARQAAALGGGHTELYDHDLRRQARRRLDQSSALRRAIDEDELLVVWQAELPIRPPDEEGGPGPGPGARHDDEPEIWAEALVRWRNPERGLVSPGNFIALAEETGLIVPVGEAVLRLALEQLTRWRAQEGTHPSRVSVNLSPRQLAQDDLAASVAAAIERAGVDPGAVMFEITESAVTAGPDDAIRRLEELRDVGVHLAMDDFGTGYSSLGYLRQVPVSVLKIDQSFIRGLTTHRADWAIVHGIVEMAHGIGLEVVAEGIETAEQLEHLVELGCDRGQGYLWSSPVPADALDELLAGWTPPRRP